MKTYIVYFDETGDDGVTTASSDVFVLTSIYMSSEVWQDNYNAFKLFRRDIKNEYGMHTTEEMHTRAFLRNRSIYRKYGWTAEQKRDILLRFATCISSLRIKTISVLIDKNNIKSNDYTVLENALTYNIQRIENDSNGQWKYLIVSDNGRTAPMRRTARKIRAYNPVSSRFGGMTNIPIKGMIEDILDKDSKESHFIQVCDFISCFASLYYKYVLKKEGLPRRIAETIDGEFVSRIMDTFEFGGILNEKASRIKYGLVVYPRK